jgi:hypothetical protein
VSGLAEPYCFDFVWGNLVTVVAGEFAAGVTISIDREPVA